MDQIDQLRRGSFMESSVDRENLRKLGNLGAPIGGSPNNYGGAIGSSTNNQNNNIILSAAEETAENLSPRVFYNNYKSAEKK